MLLACFVELESEGYFMKRTYSVFVIILILTLLLCISPDEEISAQGAGHTAYQATSWVNTGGPSGGLGYDVRMDPIDPDIMYVTDALAGVFKSMNGGSSWFPTNTGITHRLGPSSDSIPVFSLTIDPNNSNRIWLGTQYSSGIYRSDNAGESWNLMNNGIIESFLSVRGFTVEPENSDVVYMGAEISSSEWNGTPLPGLGLDMTKGVVYKTENAGQSWTRIWIGDNLARYIWIDPTNHDRLFVSTGIFDREAANSDPVGLVPGGVGILRSDNGGQTWTELDDANGLNPEELYFGSLYMHPNDPDILLAAAGNDPYATALGKPVGGIYRTSDGGDTWIEVLDGHNFSLVEICEGNPDIAYAGSISGFFRSSDAGLTWDKVKGLYWGPEDVVAGFPIDGQCDPRDPMRIIVNNYGGGNFLSIDGGNTWTNYSAGYTGALMRQIAVSMQDSRRVYASARSGLFSSSNGGGTWHGLAFPPARVLEGYAIAVDPENPTHILATLEDASGGLFSSWNGGYTWDVIDQGLWSPPVMVTQFVFTPADPQKVYATIGVAGCLIDYKAENCDNTIGKGVIVSDDGGVSWEPSGLITGTVMDLVVSPLDADLAYAMIFEGALYRTVNGGDSWEVVTPTPYPPGGSTIMTSLGLVPGDPDTLYGGYFEGAVAVSQDGGVTWQASASGMPPESVVNSLVLDPTDSNVLYAGVLSSGVYVSVDAGATWQTLNDGLLNRAVRDLAISADGSVLYMASDGGGVFRLGDIPMELVFLPMILK
jgi:photosystem II stability/assembly factor-like uncharacterized protein